MADYLNWNATNMQDFTFMRAIQDWEMTLTTFHNLIYSTKIRAKDQAC